VVSAVMGSAFKAFGVSAPSQPPLPTLDQIVNGVKQVVEAAINNAVTELETKLPDLILENNLRNDLQGAGNTFQLNTKMMYQRFLRKKQLQASDWNIFTRLARMKESGDLTTAKSAIEKAIAQLQVIASKIWHQSKGPVNANIKPGGTCGCLATSDTRFNDENNDLEYSDQCDKAYEDAYQYKEGYNQLAAATQQLMYSWLIYYRTLSEIMDRFSHCHL